MFCCRWALYLHIWIGRGFSGLFRLPWTTMRVWGIWLVYLSSVMFVHILFLVYLRLFELHHVFCAWDRLLFLWTENTFRPYHRYHARYREEICLLHHQLLLKNYLVCNKVIKLKAVSPVENGWFGNDLFPVFYEVFTRFLESCVK